MSATTAAQGASRPPPRTILAQRKAAARSRVSNQNDILSGVDGRSTTARRYRDLIANICADLGGAALLSETRLSLIRRFASLAVLAEAQEAKLACGAEVDVTQLAHVSSTLVRLAARIGMKRIAKDITPSLAEILQQSDEDEELERYPAEEP